NGTLRRLRASGLLDGQAVTTAGRIALAPYRVTGAVIMAAGMSSRFAPVSYERPKGLLVVRGEVLVERQIRQLREAGITDITVVVGYRQEQFLYLEDAFGVKIVVNREYADRNNNSSIRAVEDRLDNTYVCSSDNYFTRNPFERYVYRGYYAAVWCDGPSDEWGLEIAPSGRITGVTPGQGTDAWVMMGHAYWDRTFSQRFREILDTVYHHPDTAGKLWEAIYADHVKELVLDARRYPPGVIHEFDTLDDLRAFDPGFIRNIDSAILDNICHTLGCRRAELAGFEPITEGLTNMSFRFSARGQDYVYRHPGVATQGILNRAAEAQAEIVAAELGLDSTFVHLDPLTGWKVSRYIDQAETFSYHNPRHVRAALASIRRLHTCGRTIANDFDLMPQAEDLTERLLEGTGVNGRGRIDFPDFAVMGERARQIDAYCRADNWPIVLCHNDFYAPNILLDGDDVALIDWEYAGMGDLGSDLGVFICCSDYTWDEALETLERYYGRPPTPEELRHLVGYVGLAGYYWWVWALYKDACGEPVGEWTYLWYRFAKEYGERALALYDEAAVAAAGRAPDSRTGTGSK
ncbi:MAG: phosphotransferase, partial [Actinomycetia bacterium]|nr:phosphotransferase [Actinomycetes bacterium]